jgi:hypothetical protein
MKSMKRQVEAAIIAVKDQRRLTEALDKMQRTPSCYYVDRN